MNLLNIWMSKDLMKIYDDRNCDYSSRRGGNDLASSRAGDCVIQPSDYLRPGSG